MTETCEDAPGRDFGVPLTKLMAGDAFVKRGAFNRFYGAFWEKFSVE